MVLSRQEHHRGRQRVSGTDGTFATSGNAASDAATIYMQETKRPLVSFVFLLPLLLVYELGLWTVANGHSRNGADIFLRQLLEVAGPGISLMLPLLACAALLAWHHLTGDSWQVRTPTLVWMTLECIGFAFLLLTLAYLQRQFLNIDSSIAASVAGSDETIQSSNARLGQAIVYVGAGIYEELLFRLMLLPVCVWLLQQLLGVQWQAFAWAVAISSLVFALAHYAPFNTAGDPLALNTSLGIYAFTFRFMAGVFFATLFVRRGIGIAVGAHAAYDLIVFFG